MPAGQFLSSDLTQRYSHALLQALRGARASRTADTPDHLSDPSAIHAGGAVIERAKGALMMRYGIDSYQALAVLVRWARVAQLPCATSRTRSSMASARATPRPRRESAPWSGGWRTSFVKATLTCRDPPASPLLAGE